MVKAVPLYVRTAFAVATVFACTTDRETNVSTTDSVPVGRATAPATEATPAVDERPIVLFIGTSLTAGFGLDVTQAYPALLQARIDSAGLDYQVVNAGVSGQTSAGARNSLDWQLRRPVAVVFIETGANDGLRGIDPDELEGNIEAMVQRALEQDPPPTIILAGMEAPPNLGARYTERFRTVYRNVAERHDLSLVPFLLEGVGGVDRLNQADGIHPTAEGQRILADNAWQVLELALR